MSNFLIDDLRTSNPAAKPVAIALPTTADFYNIGEVLAMDVDPEDMEILPISSLEENMLNDPFLILSGKATTQLVKKVSPDVLMPDSLAEIDIEAILLASRIASYGEKINVSHVCQNPKRKTDDVIATEELKDEHFACREKSHLTINILQEILFNYIPLKKVAGMDDILFFSIPATNQKVHLKPISYEDSMYLFKKLYTTYEVGKNDNFDIFDDASVEKYSVKFMEMQKLAVDAVLSYIWFVESSSGQKTSDAEIIKEWYSKLDQTQLGVIQEHITLLKQYIDKLAIVKYKCESCGFDNSFRMEFDPQKLFTKAVDTGIMVQSSAPLKTITKTEKTSSRILQR